jgi:DNA-binding NarL/FixJ family response regulator
VALMRAHISVRCKLPGMEERIDEVLQLAETTGFVLRVAEAGTEVFQQVCKIARGRPRTEFVERLLAARPLLRPTSQVAPPYKVDELSAREVIVLQYLATSMSYQEIASALYLSINTVKTHVKNVLRKLSATSRAEAVRRATELHYF